MADIIQLLPDNIANQIAAGEVIQRPASVVKELLENAIDAGGDEIKLIIKDAGKTLIQVIDNGKGMSATDARMSFERHATSKIKSADDLFTITTKGFRGEALASIAAIAHVELLTRQASSDVGHRLIIRGSVVEKQEVDQSSIGASFSVKNLFFNVPARRKFLKSDSAELRHITEEFHRVALAHPDIHMSFFNNGNEIYHLPKGTIKQRIHNIFKKGIDSKLLPLNEDTDIINIEGFVGKIEAAKKSSPIQYIFVNNRFIKSNYLNHAIKSGYDLLLSKDQYPVFFIYLTMDPAKIDVNVHPTKTEVKFDEERLVYNYLRVSVKHALGRYIVSPTLDFDTDTNFVNTHSQETNKGGTNPDLYKYRSGPSELQKENLKSWENIYDNLDTNQQSIPSQEQLVFESEANRQDQQSQDREPYQLHSSYIVSHIKSGYLLIDQQLAHQRIVYERNIQAFAGNPLSIQKELFPINIEFDPKKAEIVRALMPYINKIGFDVGEFGKNGFVIHGTPSGMPPSANINSILEELIQQYNQNVELQISIEENLARSYALISSIKKGKHLSKEEMKKLIDDLFACETPFSSPSGRKTFMTVDIDDIRKYFE
jgi:DNA mismatch repair protein MutL